jgi:hypothetical protein
MHRFLLIATSLLIFALALPSPVISQHSAGSQAPGRAGDGNDRRHAAPPELEILALKLISQGHGLNIEQLQVVSSSKPNLPLTGVVIYQFIVLDNRTGDINELTLDEAGQEADLQKALNDERAAYVALYGRFEPRLAERLRSAAPNDLIPVIIELSLLSHTVDRPKYPNLRKDRDAWENLPEEEKNRIREMEYEYEKKLDRYSMERAKRASLPVLKRLSELGYNAQADKYTGAIRVALIAEIIREVEQWSEVREISLDNSVERSRNIRGNFDRQ